MVSEEGYVGLRGALSRGAERGASILALGASSKLHAIVLALAQGLIDLA